MVQEGHRSMNIGENNIGIVLKEWGKRWKEVIHLAWRWRLSLRLDTPHATRGLLGLPLKRTRGGGSVVLPKTQRPAHHYSSALFFHQAF